MQGHFGEDLNSDFYKECYESLPSRSTTYMSEWHGPQQELDPYYSSENSYPNNSQENDESHYSSMNGYE
jgi:hypothetical protein